jgi:hypothetical protein
VTFGSFPLTTVAWNVCFANGLWVAGNSDSFANVYLTSTDGVNWTSRSFPWTASGGVIAYRNLFIYRKSSYDASFSFGFSHDGINWSTPSSIPGNYAWNYPAYANNRWIIPCGGKSGSGALNQIAYSDDDGYTWFSGTAAVAGGGVMNLSGTGHPTSGYGEFLTLNLSGGLCYGYTSVDGITWTTFIHTISGDTGITSMVGGVVSGHLAAQIQPEASNSFAGYAYTSSDKIIWTLTYAFPLIVASQDYMCHSHIDQYGLPDLYGNAVFTARAAAPAWWRDKVLTSES